MKNVVSIVAVALTSAYGLLTAVAGISQTKNKDIQLWASISMIISGVLLVASAIFLAARSGLSLYVLVIGLVAMHILAVNNGLHMHGKINPAHHLVRLCISALLAGLAFWTMR